MLSGRDALGHINSTLGGARKELDRLDVGLKTTSDSLTVNRRSQAETLKQLAKIRLDALAGGAFVDSLEAADYKVQELLVRRNEAIETLAQSVLQAESALTDIESQREAAHEVVEQAAMALARCEAQVQSELTEDQAYQAQLRAARLAEQVAIGAAEKTQLADADKDSKGKPYETNKLFIYLWKRGYGTSAYSANPLTRWLDGWVADLCAYEDARRNYYMLLEIPKRLAEHADHVKSLADEQVALLRQQEEQAAQAAGVPQAQQELSRAEQNQDEVDDRLEGAEQNLQQLQTQQGTFAAGQDDYIQKGLSLLADAMNRREVTDLTDMARATLTAQDDALVADLRELRDEFDDIREELAEYRRMHGEHLDRIKELEGVRRNFKRNRYDDLRSGFDSEKIILMMLNEFLRGGVRGGSLWDTLKRQQRYRDVGGAWPDFGSGGFGIPRGNPGRRSRGRRRRSNVGRSSGPWHWPGNRGGGFRLPRGGGSPSRGGGGFRTGGGF